jgi:hypothetical protein
MAIPIRMAPVLIGKEAEYFYKVWEESLKQPTKPLSGEKRAKERK